MRQKEKRKKQNIATLSTNAIDALEAYHADSFSMHANCLLFWQRHVHQSLRASVALAPYDV